MTKTRMVLVCGIGWFAFLGCNGEPEPPMDMGVADVPVDPDALTVGDGGTQSMDQGIGGDADQPSVDGGGQDAAPTGPECLEVEDIVLLGVRVLRRSLGSGLRIQRRPAS